jgi:hypothetical protein
MVCSTVVLHAKCSLQPVLCFYCAVGPTKAPRTPHASCGTGSVSLSLSLFPLLRTLLRPNAAAAAPTTSSEALGSPSHPRRLPSMVVRTPFLPSLPHPASPRHAAGDRGPPPGHRRRGRGSPARALLSGTRSSTHMSSSPGTSPLLGRRRMDDVLCSPTPRMARSLATAGGGRGPLHYMFR